MPLNSIARPPIHANERGLIKVQLGLCRGRQAPDKRDRLRRETAARETARAIAAHVRRDG